MVNGLWIEGSWVTDANVIKEKFMLSFKDKFKERIHSRPRIGMDGFKRLADHESSELVEHFKEEEIKMAILECGSGKEYWEELKLAIMEKMQQFYIHGSIHHTCSSSFISLIPKVNDPLVFSDFRPISLIGVVNKIISKVLANRVKKVSNSIISSSQSAFISGRNIIDGPLVINEIVGWAKKTKKEIFVFKADIEKAYDTLNWKFLISILTHMGFPSKWKNWVMGILFSGRGSILVNGATTGEFHYKRGLRQGDPLSPFLFIIAMEALHVMMVKAEATGIFSGIKLPGEEITMTHLLFADDSIFMGEWDENNIKNLRRILRCYYLLSGLKVNPRKSQIFGVGVEEEEVISKAASFGFKPDKKFRGLGIGSIRDLNLSLLVKWWWQYKTEPQQLWSKVIGAIHNNRRKISAVPLKKDHTGVWKTIVGRNKDMSKRGVEIGKNLVSKVGAGDKTIFWIDVWSGEIPFLERFPLLYDLAKNKRAKVEDYYKRINDGILWEWAWLRVPNTEAENHQAENFLAILNVTTVSARGDNWIWKGEENKEFAVKSIRNTLSRNLNLNEPADNYFWNNWAAQKCSTFVWRELKGRISTATQLRERGLTILSGRCRLCDREEETPNHALGKCRETKGVWDQIGCWVKAETITQ
ncbi:uncharacterized protein LOC110875513 [Helianthus annuus]|uniref:uncharacterized protein LOC110875513 n=1 Tax=Helianthus annuus TaxID=4232 RepID=UPI000B8FB9A3|nr:uncharacterized protein LOC110875513 [Helianthus annuus]